MKPLPYRKRRKNGYAHTHLDTQKGRNICCRSCGYIGPADVLFGNVFNGERCPLCRSLNFSEVIMNVSWHVDEWKGCYPSNWKGVITPESIAHPAKFSSRLIRRIYEHMKEEEWIKEGDTVLDPFGGVGLGALDALRMGLRWRGVELEAKFHGLGNQNIQFWNARFSAMPKWSGDAVLLKGDSRKLMEVLSGKVDGAVSSPPYADSVNQGDEANDARARLERKERAGIDNSKAVTRGGPNSVLNKPQVYGSADGQLGAMKANGEKFMAALSSPPYAEARIGQESGQEHCGRGDQYGESDGQLGAMRAEGFEAAVSSPPYKNETQGGGLNINKPTTFRGVLKDGSLSMGESEGNLGKMDDSNFQAAVSSPPFRQSEGGTPEPKPGGTIDERLYARHAAGNSAAEGYGGTEGQLANMEEGSFEAAVSSPPYVSGGHHPDQTGAYNTNGRGQGQTKDTAGYGLTEGQLGKMDPDGFEAAVSSPPYGSTDLGGGGGILTRDKKMRETHGMTAEDMNYGKSNGQLGNDSGDDFWLAARQIVEQVYLALEPGGHACWVVKDFVKNKAVVPFSDQWRQLCESVGFVTIHEHHALLVKNNGASHTLDGGIVEHKTESKSFFRRLAESKGSPRIDYETVWCVQKPGGVK